MITETYFTFFVVVLSLPNCAQRPGDFLVKLSQPDQLGWQFKERNDKKNYKGHVSNRGFQGFATRATDENCIFSIAVWISVGDNIAIVAIFLLHWEALFQGNGTENSKQWWELRSGEKQKA